ncbi:hypothetical protein [Peptostreptococcus equinus]|uniref:Transposase n=1 Tax=Peptostreptococcus equinus TaxID=3003601 RepID=A0ABY7JMP4_9FIRM|nr:hypothetical protein [Peptostreptococcus sp. CBA3647]WAW14360.1 hypothetical protein O0R46_07055 [Peptostreptococcus sp. CBA3647]
MINQITKAIKKRPKNKEKNLTLTPDQFERVERLKAIKNEENSNLI